jgi:ubiquinone/menaquinone biosynthesis C-methylase UbiE
LKTRERLALTRYMFKIDIIEAVLRVFGRHVRRDTAMAATGTPSVIVDLLTGVGAVLPFYASRFPGARIIAVDMDSRLLGLVKKRLDDEAGCAIETLDADARDLPLTASSTDLVNISFGLHELKRMDRCLVLGEACRVLKPDGQLIVADYREAKGIVRRLAARLYFAFFEPRWACELFGGGLERHVADAGFDIEKVRLDLPMTQLIVAKKSTGESCRLRSV